MLLQLLMCIILFRFVFIFIFTAHRRQQDHMTGTALDEMHFGFYSFFFSVTAGYRKQKYTFETHCQNTGCV